MTIKSNLLWQFLGQGLGKGFTLLFYIVLPLSIGLEAYGEFSYAFSLGLIIFKLCVEMGLDFVITKWVSRGSFDILNKVLKIRIIMAALAVLIAFVVNLVAPLNLKLIILILFYLFISSWQNAIFAFLRGIEKMQYEAIITPIQKSVALLFLIILVSWQFSPTEEIAPLALLVSSIPGLLWLLTIAEREKKKEKPQSTPIGYKNILWEGICLGAVSFLWIIYFKIDSVMLGMMSGDREVGIYNIAYKIMEGAIFFPSTIGIVFFPKLSKQEEFTETFPQVLVILGTLGLIATILLYFLSAPIIHLIYRGEFLESIDTLKILSLVLLPIFLGTLTTQSTIALDRNRTYLLLVFLGTCINISLNYLLIPSFGGIGAALATLVTETFVMLTCGYYVWKIRPLAFSKKQFYLAIRKILHTFFAFFARNKK
jgi:PST family polysaccharide transporter